MKNKYRLILFILGLSLFCTTCSCTQKPVQQYGTYGKDTVSVLGDGKFQIMHLAGKNALVIHENTNSGEIVLEDVQIYKKTKNQLYVISQTGYASVNGEKNICKIFLKTQEINYGQNSEINNASIEYLNSFSEFNEEEQNILNNLETKYNKSQKDKI